MARRRNLLKKAQKQAGAITRPMYTQTEQDYQFGTGRTGQIFNDLGQAMGGVAPTFTQNASQLTNAYGNAVGALGSVFGNPQAGAVLGGPAANEGGAARGAMMTYGGTGAERLAGMGQATLGSLGAMTQASALQRAAAERDLLARRNMERERIRQGVPALVQDIRDRLFGQGLAGSELALRRQLGMGQLGLSQAEFDRQSAYDKNFWEYLKQAGPQ